jgi:hypothetical protein
MWELARTWVSSLAVSFESEPRPRGPQPVIQRRRRGALAPTLIILGVLVVLILILASFWTQVLWFRQVGFVQVYRTELVTRGLLFCLGLISVVVMVGLGTDSLVIGESIWLGGGALMGTGAAM